MPWTASGGADPASLTRIVDPPRSRPRHGAAPRRTVHAVTMRRDRPPGTRPAARRPPAHGPVARQQRRRSTSTRRQRSSAASPRSPSPTTSTSSPARRPSRYTTFEDRERIVRGAAERWGPQGVADPLRRRADLRPLVGGRHPRPPGPPRLRLHDRIGPRSGRLAVPPAPRRRLGRGPVAGRDRRALLRRGRGGCPVGAVRCHRPHRRRQALPLPARQAGRLRGRAGALRADPARPRRERHGARGQHQRPALRDRRDRSRTRRSSRASASSAGGR